MIPLRPEGGGYTPKLKMVQTGSIPDRTDEGIPISDYPDEETADEPQTGD